MQKVKSSKTAAKATEHEERCAVQTHHNRSTEPSNGHEENIAIPTTKTRKGGEHSIINRDPLCYNPWYRPSSPVIVLPTIEEAYEEEDLVTNNDANDQTQDLQHRIADLQSQQQNSDRLLDVLTQEQKDGYQFVVGLQDAMLARDNEWLTRDQCWASHAGWQADEIERLAANYEESDADNEELAAESEQLNAQIIELAQSLIDRNNELIKTQAECNAARDRMRDAEAEAEILRERIAKLTASSKETTPEASLDDTDESFASESSNELDDRETAVLQRLNAVLPRWQNEVLEKAKLQAQASALEELLAEIQDNEELCLEAVVNESGKNDNDNNATGSDELVTLRVANAQLLEERDNFAQLLSQEKEASETSDQHWRRRCDRAEQEQEETEAELRQARQENDELEARLARSQQQTNDDLRQELVYTQHQRDTYKQRLNESEPSQTVLDAYEDMRAD